VNGSYMYMYVKSSIILWTMAIYNSINIIVWMEAMLNLVLFCEQWQFIIQHYSVNGSYMYRYMYVKSNIILRIEATCMLNLV
jgi:hypothetical protein